MVLAALTFVLVLVTGYYAWETRLMRIAATEPSLVLAEKEWTEGYNSVRPVLINASQHSAVILDACLISKSSTYRQKIMVGRSIDPIPEGFPYVMRPSELVWLLWGDDERFSPYDLPGHYRAEIVFVYGPQATLFRLVANLDIFLHSGRLVRVTAQRLERIKYGEWMKCSTIRRTAPPSVIPRPRSGSEP